MGAAKQSTLDNPAESLQNFSLADLAQFTKEKAFSNTASRDFHLFFVGRDDVHSILKFILSRVRVSLYLNMFGYDDDELNDIVMQKVLDPRVTVLITLDKSQSGGQHEKTLLDADKKHSLAAFNTHFTVGQSLDAPDQPYESFVADGRLGAEGSTNWSASGEGIFVVTGEPGGPGYKAQNNTQTVFTDPDSVSCFQTELITEHLAARDQESAAVPAGQRQRRPLISQLPGIRANVAKRRPRGRTPRP